MLFQPHHQSQYRITSALNKEMVVDCSPNGKSVLWTWHKGANQRWRLTKVNGKYLLQNVQHSTVLKTTDNSNGTQAQCHMSKKQQTQLWELVPCNDPQYHGKNAFFLKSHCGKALDVCQGNAKQGAHIIQWDYNGNKNQIFFIESASFVALQNQHYKIVTALNQKMALDVSQNPQDKGNLILWPFQNQKNQKYTITQQNGKFTLTNLHQNDAVLVQGSNNGDRIRSAKSKQHNSQLFEFIPCQHPDYQNKDAFYIRTHCGKFLDVEKGQCKDQAKVLQWDYNGNKNQIWLIKTV